ncbi:hypothetical protein GGR58DRAFT_494904 [Xylaria digitata]|nr:hypothetical protein GGR58DRAFT_494904 [Xylaria digitata]
MRLAVFLLLLENSADPHAEYRLYTPEKTVVFFEDFLAKHFQKHQDVYLVTFNAVRSKACAKRDGSWKLTKWPF